mgnify:FL=1
MENYQDFLTRFMEKVNFPKEAITLFTKLYQEVISSPHYTDLLNTSIKKYMNSDDVGAFYDIDCLAKNMDIPSYTMSMLLLSLCAKPLKEEYHKKGVSEDIYWNSMKDLTYKLKECYQLHGIWGTFTRDWYLGFYQMNRFALGRMQYELFEFMLDTYKAKGITLHKGDKVINLHIPSEGPFDDKTRLTSYKKAYSFYKDSFDQKAIPFVCNSWLLYPAYKEILPKGSNIRSFMDDFTYIQGERSEKFNDAWRVFGKDYKCDPHNLPRKTSLQRSFADHLKNGGKTGTGYGIFFFDGDHIVKA